MKALWLDEYSNELMEDDISDRYLIRIINFIRNGGGWTYFMIENNVAERLIKEAERRNLKVNVTTEDLKEAIRQKDYNEQMWEWSIL